MKKARQLGTAFVLISLGSSCTSGDAQRLQAENSALRTEVETLKAERDELKYGAGRLLSEVEAQIGRSEWAAAKRTAEDLLSRHPASPEATVARRHLATADAAVKRAQAEATAAEARRQQAARQREAQEQRRIAAALGKMNRTFDRIENVAWYRDKTSPRFTNYNGFFLYIGKKEGGTPVLRLRVQYNADDWLFIQSFFVVADGRRFDYDPAAFERDNSSEIWEWYDEIATQRDLNMVRAVIASREAVIRFTGRQYRRDKIITAGQKAALQNVLDAYTALGGR